MGMDITAAEERALRALHESYGPLGATALGLSKILGVAHNSVSVVAKSLEHKGLCTRERIGMRIYLHPTAAGRALIASQATSEPSRPGGPDIITATVAVAATSIAFAPPAERLVESQTTILAAVARSGGTVATRRIVELTSLSDRSVHRQATRLYARGYLFRTREHRRWVWILTRKGRALLADPQTFRLCRAQSAE